MKSEPDCYSIDDLERDGQTLWDGVRNYQVRNMFRDDFTVGDKVLFYHSNAKKETGIVGVAEVVSDEAYVDPTQFDEASEHPDPKSDPANPRWLAVDVAFVQKFSNIMTLEAMKTDKSLQKLKILQKGNRLSVTPVSLTDFDLLVKKGMK